MKTLDIQTALKKCGAPKLSELVGIERLSAIVSILGGRVTESQIADILISKYGSQILAEKSIRLAILETLDKKSLEFLLSSQDEQTKELTLQ